MVTTSAVLRDLDKLIGDELQVVTYKWLGRQSKIPFDTAKRILFEYLTKNSQKVKATFFLSGWSKGDDKQHIACVVDGAELEVAKAKLKEITALHVYSVQPTALKDDTDLCNADAAQCSELFAKMLASGNDTADNPLAVNTLSSVHCSNVTRNPAKVVKPPEPAPAKAAPKPVLKKEAPVLAVKKTATKKPAAKSKAKAAPAKAKSPAKAKIDDSDDDVPVQRKKPAGKAMILDDTDSDDESADSRPPMEQQQEEAAKEEEVEKEEPATKKQKTAGTLKKAGAKGAAPKKGKKMVTKTYINDNGEEVVETVEEDVEEDDNAMDVDEKPAEPSPKPASQKTASPKPKANVESKPKPAAKKGGKAPAAGQKGIMSFFKK